MRPMRYFLSGFCWAIISFPIGAAEPVENSIGLKLVRVPAGDFIMGSPETEKGRRNDEPQRRVKLTRGFDVGQFEVTRGQFRQFVDATKYKSDVERGIRGGYGFDSDTGKLAGPDKKYTWQITGFPQTDEHPVVNVTWNDAMAFCGWLSKKENCVYRLPTEAEWEYASRGGSQTAFCNGDDAQKIVEIGNVVDKDAKAKFADRIAVAGSDGYVFTAPVGSYQANALGLHDLHGNVWEWTADWFGPPPMTSQLDPRGPETGTDKVIRGGDWYHDWSFARSAQRFPMHPTLYRRHAGFRVVRETESEYTCTDIGTRRELFVDDSLIGSLRDARRLLHHPTPREIAIVHDAPWEGAGSGYHSVIRDGDVYRMYYRGSALGVEDGKLKLGREVYCYAESRDGITFTKPELGLHDYNGSQQNNIIWTGVGTHNFAPFLDSRADCPAESRFKALGGLPSQGGLFAFQSADGIRWSLLRDSPVVTNGAFDSQNLAFWDATAGIYRAYFRTFTEGVTTSKVWKPAGYRAIRTATSRDFLSWENEADLTYQDSPVEHLYTNQIAPYIRAPHILIGFPTRYVERGWSDSMRALPEREHREQRAAAHLRYGTALTEGLLMASRDGGHFERWNEAFLRPGPERPGTWLYGHQYIAWHAVETKSSLPGAPNELSLYASEGSWHDKGNAIRRYTLRLDGFVSVTAPLTGGELIMKPLTFTGDKLTLNFATSAAGDIRVEMQDHDGKPFPGFTLADCEPIYGDTVERTVTWKNGSDVGGIAGKPVRLRFVLRDADLYSIQFAKAGD